MKKKLLNDKGKDEKTLPEDTDENIIMFIDKRKEEYNALKKILSNLNTNMSEGKSKNDQ